MTTGGLCPRCRKVDDRRRSVKAAENGLHSAHWRTVRAMRRAISGGRCELRLAGCTVRATTTHLDPRLRGNHLAATVRDCRDACRHCHGVVDAPRAHQGEGVDRISSRSHPATPRASHLAVCTDPRFLIGEVA